MLKAYFCYNKESGANECALLVFAFTSQEARYMAFKTSLLGDEYIEVMAELIKETFIFKYGNQEKITKQISHVVADPPSCKNCGLWYTDHELINNLCRHCLEIME
jgi:hypothetical protein